MGQQTSPGDTNSIGAAAPGSGLVPAASASGLTPVPQAALQATGAQANGTAEAIPPSNPLRDQAVALAAQAKLFLQRGDVKNAEEFIQRANGLRVEEREFQPGQIRPWQVAMEIEHAKRFGMNSNPSTSPITSKSPSTDAFVSTASGANATTPTSRKPANGSISSGVFQPSADTTGVQPASATVDGDEGPAAIGNGEELFRQGMVELAKGERENALKTFNRAWEFEARMEPSVRAQLKDKLTLLQGNRGSGNRAGSNEGVAALKEIDQEQAAARQRMWREVTTEIAESEKMVNNDPTGALDRLQALRQRVSQSNVDGAVRKSHLAMVDRVITNIQAYIDQNKPAIDQQERNRRIEDSMALESARRAKIDGEIQSMVDQYNDLMEKSAYTDAEIIAKKVGQLDPKSQIAHPRTNWFSESQSNQRG
jgi:general secretion pathway protein D